MTSRSLATEHCAVSTLWGPPGTLTWKSKERDSLELGWGLLGLRDVRAQEKMGVSEKLGDGLSSENMRTVATAVPSVPQCGHVRALIGRPVKVARGPWHQDARLFSTGRGYAETLVAHGSQACWGELGRVAGSAQVGFPEPRSPTEKEDIQETQGNGYIGGHQLMAALLLRALGEALLWSTGLGSRTGQRGLGS